MAIRELSAAMVSPLPRPAKAVYQAMADKVDERRLCWMSNESIVTRCDYDVRRVQRIKVALLSAGLLEEVGSGGRFRGDTRTLRMTFEIRRITKEFLELQKRWTCGTRFIDWPEDDCPPADWDFEKTPYEFKIPYSLDYHSDAVHRAEIDRAEEHRRNKREFRANQEAENTGGNMPPIPTDGVAKTEVMGGKNGVMGGNMPSKTNYPNKTNTRAHASGPSDRSPTNAGKPSLPTVTTAQGRAPAVYTGDYPDEVHHIVECKTLAKELELKDFKFQSMRESLPEIHREVARRIESDIPVPPCVLTSTLCTQVFEKYQGPQERKDDTVLIKIAKALARGEQMTAEDCRQRFRHTRLAARINELQSQYGWRFKREFIKVGKATVAKYQAEKIGVKPWESTHEAH